MTTDTRIIEQIEAEVSELLKLKEQKLDASKAADLETIRKLCKALWGVLAVVMIGLFYRKSISDVTHDKASFVKMLVVWLLAFLLVYNIVDWTLDHVPNNLRVQDIRGFTT